jgi:glycosyltransferase involved in cell wall biosynthesis
MKLHDFKISIALATYNGEKYLQEQLDSFLYQTCKPTELIVCDDGSQDETVPILRKFAQHSGITTRIYLNSVNLGFTRNFEQALSLCSGELIFMADQDDIWHPNKVQTVCEQFFTHPSICGLSHDGRLVDEDGHWHGTTKRNQIYRGYGKKNTSITGALSCIRKDALRFVLPFPKGLEGHDTWISYIFLHFPEKWLFYDYPLVDLRRHQKNTSKWVVNSFSPISKIDVFKAGVFTTPAIDYTDRLLMNETLLERLRPDLEDVLVIDKKHRLRLIYQLQKEHNSLTQRQTLAREQSKIRRCFISIRLLLSGGYVHFNGVYSFLRDLLR